MIWTQTNVLSLWTALLAYYPAVRLSGKITTFILLICNDVMHPSPGLDDWGIMGLYNRRDDKQCCWYLSDTRNPTTPVQRGGSENRHQFCPLDEVSIFWPGRHCSCTETAIPATERRAMKTVSQPQPGQCE